jgi:hypothetical protein
VYADGAKHHSNSCCIRKRYDRRGRDGTCNARNIGRDDTVNVLVVSAFCDIME